MFRNSVQFAFLVDQDDQPEHFNNPDAKIGEHRESDCFSLNAEHLLNHGVIVAQSGAGKSFLLGRIIEEIVSETNIRCVVIDPNSDYRKIGIVDSDAWEPGALYSETNTKGRLHTETIETFRKKWLSVGTMLFTNSELEIPKECANVKKSKVRIALRDISPPFLSSGYELTIAQEVQMCQLLALCYVDFLDTLSALNFTLPRIDTPVLIQKLRTATTLAKSLNHSDFKAFVEDSFSTVFSDKRSQVAQALKKYQAGAVKQSQSGELRDVWRNKSREYDHGFRALARLAEELPGIASFFTNESAQLYFRKLYDYKESELLTGWPQDPRENYDLEVIDLPSVQSSVQYALLDAVLTREWASAKRDWEVAMQGTGADLRRPTIIVVDEAHNVIPNGSTSAEVKAVREHIQRIAAEGRKYGLYLLLVSQRPEKLDELILSECENKIIMRMGSASIAHKAGERIGWSEKDMADLDKCDLFAKGEGLIAGPWTGKKTGESRKFKSASRRTVEGGKGVSTSSLMRCTAPETAGVAAVVEPEPSQQVDLVGGAKPAEVQDASTVGGSANAAVSPNGHTSETSPGPTLEA